MSKRVLTVGSIIKRYQSLDSNSESLDVNSRFNTITERLNDLNGKSITSSINESIDDFLKEMCTKDNTRKFYFKPILLIETLNSIDSKSANRVVDKVSKDMIPYVENITSLESVVESSDLTIDQKSALLESIKDARVSDRIVNNYNTLNKDFQIEAKFLPVKNIKSNIFMVLDELCACIEDYNVDSKQKLSIALETAIYILEKNNIEYNPELVSEYIQEYFVFNDGRNPEYNTVIQECSLLPEIISGYDYGYMAVNITDSIKNSIAKFLNKGYDIANIDELRCCANDALNSTFLDIKNNFPALIRLFWHAYNSDHLDRKDVEEVMKETYRKLTSKILSSDTDIPIEDIKSAINNLVKCKDSFYINSNTSMNRADRLSRFKMITQELLIDDLQDICEMFYPEYNVKCINTVAEDTTPITLEEYTNTRYSQFNRIVNKLHESIKLLEVCKNSNPTSVFVDITEDHTLNRSVGIYYIENREADINSITKTIQEFNTSIANVKNVNAYYLQITDNILEVYIQDLSNITLTTEEEYTLSNTTMAESIYTNMISECISIEESEEEETEVTDEALTEALEALVIDSFGNHIGWIPLKDTVNEDVLTEKFNLNDVKLFFMGVKDKIKKMTHKQKSAVRTINMYFKKIYKDIEKAMVSDRREQIIRGSILPSFDKLVKSGIALAGLGLVTGNPVIPIIAAIGGLAVSKHLNKKERILLLDEIDAELEVLEQEIEIAKSKNQMKKLRELLRYKKNLQRQYQRIKYNIRIGKDILPGSSKGVPTPGNK